MHVLIAWTRLPLDSVLLNNKQTSEGSACLSLPKLYQCKDFGERAPNLHTTVHHQKHAILSGCRLLVHLESVISETDILSASRSVYMWSRSHLAIPS